MTQPHYFIAIPIEQGVKGKLANWNRLQHPPFERFVHEHDYHITLVFLGGIEQFVLNELQGALRKVAKNHQPFPLVLNMPGSFGQKQSPRIFWAGLKREEKLYRLQNDVFQTCVKLGIKVEERAYNPHITLARKYIGEGPYGDEQLKKSFQSFIKNESWTVSNFVIYRTHLDKVPKYEISSSFPLEKN